MTAREADPRAGPLTLEQRIELPGANNRKPREKWKEGGAGELALLTDGVERVDGRVGDGDERDAVGAHLHGDPDRPRGHGRPLAGWIAAGARRRRERDGRGGEAGGDVRERVKLGRLERWEGRRRRSEVGRKRKRRKLPRREHSVVPNPCGVIYPSIHPSGAVRCGWVAWTDRHGTDSSALFSHYGYYD
jgi:hypothetical protein